MDAMDIDAQPADADALFLADVRANVQLVARALTSSEPRFVTRALRASAPLRRRLTATRVKAALDAHVPAAHAVHAAVGAALGDTDAPMAEPAAGTDADAAAAYIGYLALVHLHDAKRLPEAAKLSAVLVQSLHTANRRALDQLGARTWFYWSRVRELLGTDTTARASLLAAHRTAVLRRDPETALTTLNLALRDLLAHNQVDAAAKLVAKAQITEGGLAQMARLHYYTGKIYAIQLAYTAAHTELQHAVRKAPPAATGFVLAATKLSVIVQLLMGEIPERHTFRKFGTALEPYRQLVLAVRRGDLAAFAHAAADPAFARDGTLSLIARLRHNVIKAGMRRVAQAYSHISLRDICTLLALDAEEDAEYIVAKAVRDGVLSARVDHALGTVHCHEADVDVYATREPRDAFHARIGYCLETHNACVRALRFPDKIKQVVHSTADEVRELELEIQQHLEEEGDEF